MTVEANENWGLHPRYIEISVKLLKIAQPLASVQFELALLKIQSQMK